MRRSLGIVFGLTVHALFAVTVWHLIWFLEGGEPAAGATSLPTGLALAVDALLAGLFAVPHSLFLMPAIRRRIVTQGFPAPLYGCLYCLITCVALLTTILCWQRVPVVVWAWPAPADTLMAWCFVAAWGGLLASLHLTGLGWQTGLTPWWHWIRSQPQPKRDFVERGAYRVLRHPVYLSFLGLVWFVPVITLDRVVLMAVWSVYIFIGSVLKDRRLVHYIGAAYREYQSRVPGYPGMPCGPLARVPAARSVAMPPTTSLSPS